VGRRQGRGGAGVIAPVGNGLVSAVTGVGCDGNRLRVGV
jgi:hypothetical protein